MMMRTFIAINLSDSVKNGLLDVMCRMRDASVKGNFTRTENLHLTLAFLGEIPPARMREAKQAMNSVMAGPFELALSGFGNFSNTYWVGIDKNDPLIRIQADLSAELKKFGFQIENREYKPHLTLCREATFESTFNKADFSGSIEPMRMTVDRISLMKSERVNGRMVYTEMYSSVFCISEN